MTRKLNNMYHSKSKKFNIKGGDINDEGKHISMTSFTNDVQDAWVNDKDIISPTGALESFVDDEFYIGTNVSVPKVNAGRTDSNPLKFGQVVATSEQVYQFLKYELKNNEDYEYWEKYVSMRRSEYAPESYVALRGNSLRNFKRNTTAGRPQIHYNFETNVWHQNTTFYSEQLKTNIVLWTYNSNLNLFTLKDGNIISPENLPSEEKLLIFKLFQIREKDFYTLQKLEENVEYTKLVLDDTSLTLNQLESPNEEAKLNLKVAQENYKKSIQEKNNFIELQKSNEKLLLLTKQRKQKRQEKNELLSTVTTPQSLIMTNNTQSNELNELPISTIPLPQTLFQTLPKPLTQPFTQPLPQVQNTYNNLYVTRIKDLLMKNKLRKQPRRIFLNSPLKSKPSPVFKRSKSLNLKVKRKSPKARKPKSPTSLKKKRKSSLSLKRKRKSRKAKRKTVQGKASKQAKRKNVKRRRS
jgi:hypothetical protein